MEKDTRDDKSPNVDPVCLRPKHAAQYLDVGTNFIYDRLNSGEIPFIKAGNTTLILRAELDAWLARKAAEGGALLHRGRGYRRATSRTPRKAVGV